MDFALKTSPHPQPLGKGQVKIPSPPNTHLCIQGGRGLHASEIQGLFLLSPGFSIRIIKPGAELRPNTAL